MNETIFNGKTIFVSGGTGSWGCELVRQLLDRYYSKRVIIYSRGEHKQVEMKRQFGHNPKLKFIIGDVRDKNILGLAMKSVDYVFHLAALKHVPVCEENCWEAVLTNIYGTQNIIECAIENDIKIVIDISTDKAVDPFNLYGVTKACGEKLMINANQNYISNTKFVCIRGGNVMGTNGSVLPLFKNQIISGNEITVTDPEMTRYLMSTKEAIGLVFEAVQNAVGGEIFVMRMPATKVENIANVMTSIFGNKKTKRRIIGVRPGEKFHEVLVSKNESPQTRVFSDKYYVILPQYNRPGLEKKYSSLKPIEFEEFNSNNARRLSDEEFTAILKKEDWLWRD
ncbi:MAG: polysaccharide biosynthesis protein [Patescibacteria group bacterium]